MVCLILIVVLGFMGINTVTNRHPGSMMGPLALLT